MLNETAMKIYQYIKEAIENDYPPTVREICDALGIRSTSTVHKYINLLADEGYIDKLDKHNRAIRLKNAENTINVPLIENINAGIPLTAEENISGHICFTTEKEYSCNLFAVRMPDNSMSDSGILKGDIIIAEQTDHAEIGDLAAVLTVSGGITVRVLCPESGNIIEILGKVTALQRFF